SAGSESLIQDWFVPRVSVSCRSEVKATAVRPPGGVRKRRTQWSEEPDRTGTKRVPAGVGCEGSASWALVCSGMVSLLTTYASPGPRCGSGALAPRYARVPHTVAGP